MNVQHTDQVVLIVGKNSTRVDALCSQLAESCISTMGCYGASVAKDWISMHEDLFMKVFWDLQDFDVVETDDFLEFIKTQTDGLECCLLDDIDAALGSLSPQPLRAVGQ